MNNNPIQFTDSSGQWIETAFDTASPVSLAMTINDIRNEGFTVMNTISLVTDVAAVALPFVPAGVSQALRTAKYANKAVNAVDTAADAGKVANKLDNVIDTTSRARKIKYDGSLSAGEGFTDMKGNITISPHGTDLDRSLARFHEEVHSFFTPRGPFQETRAKFSMWAYNNSALFKYTEEALAESVAQIRTGGSLLTGLKFPIANKYVSRKRLVLETAGLAAGIYWGSNKLSEVFGE